MIKAENYFEVFLIIFFLSLFIYIIKEFLFAIFLAITLVFIFYKPNRLLTKLIRIRSISAIIMMLISLALIILPTYFIGVALVKESNDLINSGTKVYQEVSIENCDYYICEKIKKNTIYLNFNIEDLIKKVGQFFFNSITDIFNSITNWLINLFIFILAFFYLLVDGERFVKYLKKIVPMKNEYKEAMFKRIKEVSLAVFIDSIFVALIQGGLVAIGFWVFELNSPIFWGIIASFFALIPLVGTAFVWIPALIYLILIKQYVFAISFFAYCILVVSLSDNIIRAILMKHKIKVHSFLILISILGAIQVFGFIGIFLGPLIISLLISILQLYNLDFK
jgi:predicted PurR-regulated permease PerM